MLLKNINKIKHKVNLHVIVVIYQKEYRIKTFVFYGECFIAESIPNLASFRAFSRRPPKDIASALYKAGTKRVATIFSEVESQGWKGKGVVFSNEK